jgi:gliding motility-associated-like protein
MYLQEKIDTCNKTVLLTWTPYIGWNKLKYYYIFKQYNIGEPFLYDSVSAGIRSYTDSFTLGLTYAYFIRSVKDTAPFISSSSNSIRFTTRYRKEPKNSYLSLVTISKPNDDHFAVSLFNPEEEVNKYEIFMSTSLQEIFDFKAEIINASSLTTSYTTIIPFLPSIKLTKVVAYNNCNESYPVSPITEHINLTVVSDNGKNSLMWNPYLAWTVGVNKHLIYRGTNNPQGVFEYSLFDSVTSGTHAFIDSLLPINAGELGVCYYVAAIQNGGDLNGQRLISNSTTACVLAPFLVYIPNAFRPEGVNQFFRPEGGSINYEDSEMEIYDRWGSRIVSIKNIRAGWDGKDDSGKPYMQGVYFYKFNLKSTNGTEKFFSGFITLLN